jgi:hypothetical protein
MVPLPEENVSMIFSKTVAACEEDSSSQASTTLSRAFYSANSVIRLYATQEINNSDPPNRDPSQTLRRVHMSGIARNHRTTRPIIKSFRLAESQLLLIRDECARRKLSFSDFARLCLLGNLSKETKRNAITLWGQSQL